MHSIRGSSTAAQLDHTTVKQRVEISLKRRAKLGHTDTHSTGNMSAAVIDQEDMVKPIPRLDLAQMRFELTHASKLDNIDVAAVKQKILDIITENSMCVLAAITAGVQL